MPEDELLGNNHPDQVQTRIGLPSWADQDSTFTERVQRQVAAGQACTIREALGSNYKIQDYNSQYVDTYAIAKSIYDQYKDSPGLLNKIKEALDEAYGEK